MSDGGPQFLQLVLLVGGLPKIITSLQMLLSCRGQKSTKNEPDLDLLPAVFSSHLIVISSAARQFFPRKPGARIVSSCGILKQIPSI